MAYNQKGEQRNTGRTHFKKGFIPWNKGKRGTKCNLTAEGRLSLVNKMSGVNNPFYGKTHSAETIEKIRLAHIGKPSKRWKGGYQNKLHLNNKRRIQKIGNGGSHTLGDWEQLKSRYDYKCLACKLKESEITLSRDHIIPISHGGSDDISNIQPLCRSCNSIKHTKTIIYA